MLWSRQQGHSVYNNLMRPLLWILLIVIIAVVVYVAMTRRGPRV